MGGTRRRVGITVAGVVALALVVVAGVALTHRHRPGTEGARYRNATLSPAERVADLLSRMSLDDKLGQMVQGERADVGPADVQASRLGSVLSGGGSAPDPDTPAGWADMYDAYQRAALATPLGIPILYGLD